MAHEIGEQPKLGRGQGYLAAGARGEAVLLVDEHPLDLEHLRNRAPAPQDSAHARHQLLEREGLDEVVIGSEFQSGDAVGHGVAGCEEDD